MSLPSTLGADRSAQHNGVFHDTKAAVVRCSSQRLQAIKNYLFQGRRRPRRGGEAYLQYSTFCMPNTQPNNHLSTRCPRYYLLLLHIKKNAQSIDKGQHRSSSMFYHTKGRLFKTLVLPYLLILQQYRLQRLSPGWVGHFPLPKHETLNMRH